MCSDTPTERTKGKQFGFKKSERLCSTIAINELVQNGNTINHFPFRLLYTVASQAEVIRSSTVQIAIAVPKKKFKRAVDRNLLKRRIREAYRLNKATLYDVTERKAATLNLLLVYVSTEILPYGEIEVKLIKLLERLAQRLEKDTDIHSGTVG